MPKLPNIHPGEVLLEEFLTPMGISQNALARSTGVPPRRINEIVLGKRAVTADTALRFAHYLGTSEQLWMTLQASFDLEEARGKLGRRLEKLEQAPFKEMAREREDWSDLEGTTADGLDPAERW